VRNLSAAAATLLLAACAVPGFLLPQKDLEFELTGRIAMKVRDEAGSGHIAWRHSASDDELLFTTPLGQGIARLARTAGEITLTMQDGREYKAANAELLTENALGFRVPLEGLADWVRARPAPGVAFTRKDAAGRVARIEQSGWTVDYLEYAGNLPSRLVLTYPGVQLRLAISDWK
jgi:outer membrane lipoprotein LolB